MEFSLNYSIEAIELLNQRAIQIDRLKCADWPDMIAAARKEKPVYVHFPFDVGALQGRETNYAAAIEMSRDTKTPYINFHIVSYDRDFPKLPRDSQDPASSVIFRNRLLADIQAAIDHVGRDRVIIENIPWFGAQGEFHRWSVEPEVICDAVRSTRVGFLLDLSHARIAAHYLGIDPKKYLESLPVDQLKELHITGVRMHKTRLADHLDLQDEDWKFFDWAMDRIDAGNWAKPWTVAFEYGGIGEPFKWRSDVNVLRQQVPRLYDRVKASS